jgi:putative ABC transport system ATP-binding protein
MENPVLEIKGLTKVYRSGERNLTVLDKVSLSLAQGSCCAVVGPSGSGKTTLLGLCAGLDRPTSGSVFLDGVSLNQLDEDQLAQVRSESVGFVFQTFQLISTLTALENVVVPLELRAETGVRRRAIELLDQVGLGDRLDHYPTQLSGGEQQRVSLARAFINHPKILFADEPTGNLDAETSEKVTNLLFELNNAFATTLVLVTHDLELARQTQRVIELKGGVIHSDQNLHDQSKNLAL